MRTRRIAGPLYAHHENAGMILSYRFCHHVRRFAVLHYAADRKAPVALYAELLYGCCAGIQKGGGLGGPPRMNHHESPMKYLSERGRSSHCGGGRFVLFNSQHHPTTGNRPIRPQPDQLPASLRYRSRSDRRRTAAPHPPASEPRLPAESQNDCGCPRA